MNHLLASIAAALRDHKQTLATAESCTGGLLGAALTRLPGSSAWYVGGMVAYSNDLKIRLLGVPREIIQRQGAVSAAAAKAMAEGARKQCQAGYAVSITGIAGPGGGTQNKPVGLVFIAVAGPAGNTNGWKYHFSGSRTRIRATAVKTALARLRDTMAP